MVENDYIKKEFWKNGRQTGAKNVHLCRSFKKGCFRNWKFVEGLFFFIYSITSHFSLQIFRSQHISLCSNKNFWNCLIHLTTSVCKFYFSSAHYNKVKLLKRNLPKLYNSPTKKSQESNLAFISLISRTNAFKNKMKKVNLTKQHQLAAFPLVLLLVIQFIFFWKVAKA